MPQPDGPMSAVICFGADVERDVADRPERPVVDGTSRSRRPVRRAAPLSASGAGSPARATRIRLVAVGRSAVRDRVGWWSSGSGVGVASATGRVRFA